MHLYTHPLCPYAHRVRLTLAEKGLGAQRVEIDLRNKPASFRALSPRGTVPVLQLDAGAALWNSAAIAEYLEDAHPQPALLPGDPVMRARARTWIRFADDHLYANTDRLLHSRDTAVREAALSAVLDDLRFMEAHAFADHAGPYWLGAAFTLADAAIYPWFEQRAALARFRGFVWPAECRRLLRWEAAVAARPTVQAESRPEAYYLGVYEALAQAAGGA